MKEFYAGASYYGIGKIIKEYANFPDLLPCPVSIQHGWAETTHIHDARYDAAENWFWTKDLATKYQNEYEGLNVRVVGSPFLYLLANLNYVESSKKRGSIVFPAHSSKLVMVKCDFDKYADMLEELSDEYKPITICMYYLDIERGLDTPFRKKGFDIVKNGNSLYDPDFIKQFIKNAYGKKYAFSNQTTSALLYTSIMGLNSFFYGPQFTVEAALDSYHQTLEYIEDTKPWYYQPSLHFQFPNCNIQRQKEFVFKELGQSFLLSPREMNEVLYKSVFSKQYFYKLLFQGSKDLVKTYAPIIYRLYTRHKNKTHDSSV